MAEPMSVRLSPPDPAIQAMPLEDRQWLSDEGFRLLLPLPRSSGELLGILALGAKRSELPFTREDRLLLSTVAASARATLEDRILSAPRTEGGEEADRPASECHKCGALGPAGDQECPRCGGRMQTSKVPLTLRAKFRLEARIGRGGMGVVYRATDLHLGRLVAVKTLPWVAPYLSSRLRREARAMAAISHPNLAMIYGVEFFHGIPMLVVEYLAGGTLADRLREGPMSWPETVALGVTLAEVVDRLHAAGILHRDIKPSNVGFTGDGIPKLLDFGLARAIEAARALELPEPPMAGGVTAEAFTDGESGDGSDDSLTGAGAVAGTIAYLSPEAINGDAPDPSFDLWGVCVALYEAIAGSNPMRGGPQHLAQPRAAFGDVPDIREYAPGCPAEVAEFFLEALHADPKRRPPTGRALARRLRGLLEQPASVTSPT
jgi:Serine/threonine protein kinase